MLSIDRQAERERKRAAFINDLLLGALILALLAGCLGIIVLLLMTHAAATPVCLTKHEARQLWPREHIYWYSANHCWSNRRGGPPRNIRYDLIRENHAQSSPALPEDRTPEVAGRGDRASVNAPQPNRGAVASKVIKIVKWGDYNELDAQADADTFFNAKPFTYQQYVLNLDRYRSTFWYQQLWGLAKEGK